MGWFTLRKLQEIYIEELENINMKGEGSFMSRHMEEYHEGQEPDFTARVTHRNKECLSRQVREGV